MVSRCRRDRGGVGHRGGSGSPGTAPLKSRVVYGSPRITGFVKHVDDRNQGLNDPVKCRVVADFLASSSVTFYCLLETRVRRENFGMVMSRFGDAWSCMCSYSVQGVGRIWVMWRKSVYDFSIDISGDQFIYGTLVDIVSNTRVHIGVMYASNHVSERRNLWSRLIDVCASWQLPGVVLGDFNVIRSSSEDFSGCPSLKEMEKFDGVLLEGDLVELGVIGNWFTWTSKLQGNGILWRLDRCLSNEKWKVAFPYSEVRVGQWGISDHSPLLVSTGETRNRPPPTFCYFTHWAEADSIINTIRCISVLADEVRAARKVMEAAQVAVERNPDSESVCAEAAWTTEVFWSVARLEEASLWQKAKVRWLELGDINTAFFHRCFRSRRSCSGLFTVVDAWGTHQTVHDMVAVEFFRGCLGAQHVGYRDLTARIGDNVQFNWPEEGVETLGQPVNREKIQKALFSMKSGKAPGPDGFSVDFYRAA
ncbi:uncharacterized protein LOC120083970 [Benincasa hispida]|uniref:uncharacterized protein LOC120083970 n=1 Tax=Benincasa hispida TaxID=102211 RepID=UPI00190063DB|nr:uncharacterized protein LOC120083970 [Benincasa hispida]